MIATPPESLANLSCNFSVSNSDVDSSICFLIWEILSLIAPALPRPSTIVVFSLSIVTVLADPNWSTVTCFKSIPSSSLITVVPVNIAISSNIAFLLSPKPGALTATTSNVPRSLLTTIVANASPSTSSATIINFKFCCIVCSKIGNISCKFVIFLSVTRINGCE